MSLRRDELKAAIETAHARGLKVTGHLRAVGFQEAARLGIDNLEHGLLQDSEFTAGKQPDQCPDSSETLATVLSMNVAGPSIQRTIATMIQHGVALTSTLAVFESFGHGPASTRGRSRSSRRERSNAIGRSRRS